jgi:DNA repair protein SbcC/Rad50
MFLRGRSFNMKIKKIIISAFGPYAERQELDFEENLQDKNIFVITGNTGAGKTTIFDAINFALYGEASGSDRDGKSLRSDFADAETKTEVELWFSMRNKDYYVKRSPQYFRRKQRGEGFTENKATAEIKLKDKTITGTKEVTKTVEEILGINSEQFKQLVMIPQGEFKKLLNSDSDKKEEIFRKIFGTKIFADIQQNIKNEANELKRKIEFIQRDRENSVKSFVVREENNSLKEITSAKDINIVQATKGFEEEIAFDENNISEMKVVLEKLQNEIDSISKELAIINETNKKLDKKEAYKLELEKLNLLKSQYEIKEIKLEKAKKAIKLAVYEKDFREKKYQTDKIKDELIKSVDNIKKYKEDFFITDKKLKEEKSKENIKNQLLNQLNDIDKLKEKASRYEENKNKVTKLNKLVLSTENKINDDKLEINKNTEIITNLTFELEKINNFKSKKNELDINLISLNKKKENLNKLIDSLEFYNKDENNHKNGAAFYEKANDDYKKAKDYYEEKEDAFRRNQAGILAKDLKEGDSCPVCGSINHPKVAILNNEDINENLVKKAKIESDKLYETREKYYRELSNINANLQSNKVKVIIPLLKEVFNQDDFENVDLEINKVKDLISVNKIELKEINKELEEINKVISKEAERATERKNTEVKNDNLRNELEEKSKELLSYKENLKVEETNLKNIESEFNGEVKSCNELEALRKNIGFEIEKLKKDYDDAEKEFKEIKTHLDKENGNKESLEIREKELKTELEESIKIFKENTLNLGFADGSDYLKSKLKEEEIELLEKDINSFNNQLLNTEKLYIEITKECEGISKKDAKEIEINLENKKSEKASLQNTEKKLFSKIEQNKKSLENIKKFNKLIEDDEKKYSTLGRLSKIINGDNPRRISFERYVLATYFEYIIAAANLRLLKMTCNRFELLRKEEVGDKRKGQGLDLEVLDNHTGKSRDVKTLSGGECFKASLSMALGLADVVQAYSGGIQLDTIFVDEGFGTLDPESLDNAIECLVELQNDGRLVGIISHVQELKDRIDSKIIVTSTNKGSKAEFR